MERTTRKKCSAKRREMDRKFLEDMGIEKENIDKILDQNMDEIGVLNARIKTKDTEISTLRTDLATANGKIADLEKVDVEDLKTQLQNEKDARAKDKKEFTLRSLLQKEGCTDVEYLLYKLGEKVEFDEKSDVKDSENFMKSLKEEYAAHFNEETPGGTGSSGNFRRNRNETPPDFSKMTYSEMAAYMAEHPEAKID